MPKILSPDQVALYRRDGFAFPVPVLDGMRCAIPQAEALVRVGARKPTTGSYASTGERATRGLDPALVAMFKGK